MKLNWSCKKALRSSFLITVFFTSIVKDAEAQSYSSIIYDKNLSENVGANSLRTLHNALSAFQDQNIPDSLFVENNAGTKSAGIGYRLAKMIVLDQQISGLVSLLQHEVFGHGARFRELGYDGNSYNVNLSFPFGSGEGFAQRGNLTDGYSAPTLQEGVVAGAIGGVESNSVLGNHLSAQILLNDALHYREALLYLLTQNNLLGYLWITRNNPGKLGLSNDMNNYIAGMNTLYPTGNRYDIDKLSNQSLISLINPLQYYSFASVLYQYLVMGQKQLKGIPMIKLGKVKYLPLLNYSLTPFGSQYHFMNYVRYKTMLFSADFKLGDNTFNNFYGLSLQGFNLVDTKKLAFNAHLDIWNQPELALEPNTTPGTENKIGGAIKADLIFRPFNQQNKLGLFLQMGYKTKGYTRGELLDKSFIIRYGISMRIAQR